MAESAALALKANGVDIEGDSTVTTNGRENSIECLYYQQDATIPRERATGAATGRRQYGPIIIRKRIDRSSPLIAKALTRNETIEGTFRFFRTGSGGGASEHFYTVRIGSARVSSIKQYLPDVLNTDTADLPMLEEVWFTFGTIAWTFVEGGIEQEDDLTEEA